MFRNYLKIAFRTLWKNRTYTSINVLGLGVALGTCVLLFLTVAHEWSFDRFHQNANRIYRLYWLQTNRDGSPVRSTSMPVPLTPALKSEIPEIEAATRLYATSAGVRYRGRTFGKMIRPVDADYLRMFTFPMRQGNPNTALTGLSDVVISNQMAKVVFGAENPVGKSLDIRLTDQWKPFTVTGVISDFPENSTQTYDAFVRVENAPDYTANQSIWYNHTHEVYVELAPGVKPETVAAKLQGFVDKYRATDVQDRQKAGYPLNELGHPISLALMPLTDVHFDTVTDNGMGVSRAYIYTLLLVGVFMLAIACINFVNLTIAQSLGRAREVGIRKALGAQRGQLIGQIWGETVLLCGLALMLGLGLAYTLLPTYNQLFEVHLRLQDFLNPNALAAVGLGFLVVTLVAGGYPSAYITRFKAVEVLKGRLKVGRPGWLRNGLIVSQFTMTCLLITCTLVVRQQLTYLQEKPIGLNREQVVSIPVGSDQNGNEALRQLRERLANQPQIVAVSGTGVNIGAGLDGSSSRNVYGFEYKKRDVRCDWLRIDYDYLKTMDVKLVAGRDFSPQFGTDSSSAVLITQSMAQQMGEANPIGATIRPADRPFQVVGVVSDFNLYSLHQKATPIVLQMQPDSPIRYLLVRVNPQHLTEAMQTIKDTWKTIAPKQEFIGSFLDENTQRWYEKEARLKQLFSLATVVAILLSCMGLFSITLLTVEQRTKEIGVRKVLGASVAGIVALLSKDFLKLVAVGVLLATPVAWWAMQKWLADFAYRIDLSWWLFALAGLLAIVIALLTVSYQAIRAALMNPVKSLRSE